MKKIFALMLALCLAMCCVSAMAEEDTYVIGICQLMQHPALDEATQGFKDALTEKLGDKVTFEEQNASGDAVNCATILGTSITDYATALGMSEFTGVTGINVSGTSDLAPLDGQAAMIQELFPDAKTVGLLYCSAEANSLYQVNIIKGYLTEMGYECKEYAFTDSNDIASVAQLATECEVIYIPTDNTAASYTETIANVVLPAKVPVVAGEEGICKGCGVATLTISYYDIGYTTGEMAYEILVNGADITTMPIQSAPQFTKKYNAANAAELGLTIPEDYEAIAE